MDYGYSSSEDSSEDEAGPLLPLHDAVYKKDLGRVEELLQKGKEAEEDGEGIDFDPGTSEDLVDVDERDNYRQTALHLALENGWLAGAKALLAAGAQVEKKCEGSGVLHIAVCSAAQPHRGNFGVEAVSLLMEIGASPYTRDDQGRTPLHWAAVYGLCDVGELLLQVPPVVLPLSAEDELPKPPQHLMELLDKHNCSALLLAAKAPHPEFVKLLMRPGAPWANPAAALVCNKAGQGPLHHAAAQGCVVSCVAIVEAEPAARRLSDKRKRTPADCAHLRKHEVLAAWLRSPLTPPPPPVSFLSVRQPTAILAPHKCLEHRTAAEPIPVGKDIPPENVNRLHVLTHPEAGILRSSGFSHLIWDEESRKIPIADLLRVHEWNYVLNIQEACNRIPDSPGAIGGLDGDTAISHGTYEAALVAAGAVCHGVDMIMKGQARNVFCAVRPPGHHAGPTGKVTCRNDPIGSHGFCIFNNVALGASYAMNMHRAAIKKVAILDFDVHHGNGTQACVANLSPHTMQCLIKTPFSSGVQSFPTWKPWQDENDVDNVFFASVQGYGLKRREEPMSGYVYPGSGKTADTRAQPTADTPLPNGAARPAEPSGAVAALADEAAAPPVAVPPVPPNADSDDAIPEDPRHEFTKGPSGDDPSPTGPRIINVGIAQTEAAKWRRAWRDKILPALVKFHPDIIFVSAGFDAHRKDDINYHYIGIVERDFEWITEQIVMVANGCCEGRVVSVLEGGYRIHGGVVSAFSRSAAAHVKALQDPNLQVWDPADAEMERVKEDQRAVVERRRAEAAKAAEDAMKKEQLEQVMAVLEQRKNLVRGEETVVAGEIEEEDAPLQKRRRRSGPVDYAALNVKLEEELAHHPVLHDPTHAGVG